MPNFFPITNNSPINWQSDNLVNKFIEELTKIENSSEVIEALQGYNLISEKIIGTNNLKSISLISKISRISNAICLIHRADGGRGTGFLITPNLIMTNWHVFKTIQTAIGAIGRFNYQQDENGNFLPISDYLIHPDDFYHSNEELDYAVVSIYGFPDSNDNQVPGEVWGTIPLKPNDIQGEDCFLIHHPAGLPKQISLSANEIKYYDESIIQYLTDSLPGSSGAPLFDDNFNLIGLHHKGGNLVEPETGLIYYRNQGIRISAIVNVIPDLNI